MSVSEWGMPIKRGGVDTAVGEYSISTIGPGERARHHWELARARGMRTVAKVQCGNTWELSAVPYIPAVANVARHAANLRRLGVNGLMLGWTLGGYPSPNLEVVAELGAALGGQRGTGPGQRDGASGGAPLRQRNWRRRWCAPGRSTAKAFSEFPFHGSLVYNAPMQVGPANPLWGEPTGYRASMVGFPYDDLDAWRAVYPPEVFIGQFEKVATGFERAHANLAAAFEACRGKLTAEQRTAALQELSVGEAAAIHFRSVANQARFVLARRRLKAGEVPGRCRSPPARNWNGCCGRRLALARRLHAIQSRDSRIGFEASNQYYYVPVDLAEKVINCQDLLTRWLPAERSAPTFQSAQTSRAHHRMALCGRRSARTDVRG